MSEIRNTTEDMNDPTRLGMFLGLGLGFGGSDQLTEYVTGQERSGQVQLVNSDRLPTDTRGTDEDFIALGFTFSPPDPRDPLFRPATLPAGWSRRAMDHAMGSEIVDQHGRERVSTPDLNGLTHLTIAELLAMGQRAAGTAEALDRMTDDRNRWKSEATALKRDLTTIRRALGVQP